MTQWYIVLVGVLLSTSSGYAQGIAKSFEPRPITAERWTESFSVIADLTGGVFVKVNQLISNVGIGDGKSACRIVLHRSGLEAESLSDDFGDDWTADGAKKSLKVGSCLVINAPQGLRVQAELEGLAVDMQFAERAKRVQGPGGVLSDGDSFYEYDIALPWSPVTARLTREGQVETLQGFGFSDHSRATSMPRDIAYQWFRFLGLQKTDSLMFRVRALNPGKDMTGWRWAQSETGPSVGMPRIVGLETVPEGAGFKFDVIFGEDVYQVSVDELVLHFAPLDELGLLGVMIRPWLGNPETRTYRARVKKGATLWNGLLEIATNYD